MRNTNSSTAAVGDASAPENHLMCFFRTRKENCDDVGKESTSGKAPLFREMGKKSSYILQQKQEKALKNSDETDGIQWHSIPEPAHITVEHSESSGAGCTTGSKKDCTFFFGGLQLVFSAKTIEIYLTSPEGKETYLMTCKGIPYKLNEKENVSEASSPIQPQLVEWRRALCVVPGGPRCVSRLRIKIMGSTSKSDRTIKLQHMKLTARIVDPSPSSTSTATPTNPPITTTNLEEIKKKLPSLNPSLFAPATTFANATSPSEPPLTQKDLGAAMAGLSFMARKTEENMANLFKQQSNKIENDLDSFLKRIELQMCALKPTLAVQHQLLKENQIIMKEQQQMMEFQNTQINKLLTDNQDLKVRVQSLQADISILRSQAPYSHAEEAKSSNQNGTEIKKASGVGKGLSSKHQPDEAENALPSALTTERNHMEMENVHLRNVLQNVARGIDEEPLLRGCGGTPIMYNGVDEDSTPYLANKASKYPIPGEKMKTKDIDIRKVASKTVKDIDEMPYDGGCGSILHGFETEIMKKVDLAISSRIKPSAISLDTTRSIKNIEKKYCEEPYNHTSNIEVTLMPDEHETDDVEDHEGVNGEDKEESIIQNLVDESKSIEMLEGKSREEIA